MHAKEAIDFIVNKLKSGLPSELTYHSYEHTLSVIDAAKTIATAEGIIEPQLSLILTAAAYHDCGFLYIYEDHESASCNIANEVLPSFGFSENDISLIIGMIMAGKVPQSPTNHFEMILCDADLDYLGGDNYESISRFLFEELNAFGYPLSESEWLNLQIDFLSAHKYWTNFSMEHRRPKKLEVLEKLKKQKEFL